MMSSMAAIPVSTRILPSDGISSLLDAFERITLDELEHSDARLLNRKEIKFVMKAGQFVDLLSELRASYRVLDVNNTRMSRYETQYYDTDAFTTYLQHQNGKANRSKVRIRHYCSSCETYMEIKEKRNTGRTIKKRLETAIDSSIHAPDLESLLKAAFPEEYQSFHPVLKTDYTRITLVSRDMKERITFDLRLSFSSRGRVQSFPDVVIGEIKHDGSLRESPARAALKSMHIRRTGFSKYCIGIALLYCELKHNRFKPKLLMLEKLSQGGILDVE